MYDLLIIGGGPAAISCGLVLGSAAQKPYMTDKKIGMIAHQKFADLNAALVNNLFGVEVGTKGKELMGKEFEKLQNFKNIEQLPQDVIEGVVEKDGYYEVTTEHNSYEAKQVVLAIGHHPRIGQIKGLDKYIVEHTKSLPGVAKTALKNTNLVVKEGLYVAGLTSGCASQVAIAVGTGADVAVQLLTKWNNGIFDHHHDK